MVTKSMIFFTAILFLLAGCMDGNTGGAGDEVMNVESTSTSMPPETRAPVSTPVSTTVESVPVTYPASTTLGEREDMEDVHVNEKMEPLSVGEVFRLPEPVVKGEVSVEEALKNRRSRRSYLDEPLDIAKVAQLLWAAQGVTEGSKRTSPSAGSTYPLEVYVVASESFGGGAGVYRYDPLKHSIKKVLEGDRRKELQAASFDQYAVGNAPVDIVFTAVYERTTGEYGEESKKYVYMEAGHAAQNVYLQAEALGLGTVVMGAFEEEKVAAVLDLPAEEKPLYIMPVGRV